MGHADEYYNPDCQLNSSMNQMTITGEQSQYSQDQYGQPQYGDNQRDDDTTGERSFSDWGTGKKIMVGGGGAALAAYGLHKYKEHQEHKEELAHAHGPPPKGM